MKFEELAEKRANERVEKVRKEVQEETRIETLFNSIKNLIVSMKWTEEQAMAVMNISENDQKLLKTKL